MLSGVRRLVATLLRKPSRDELGPLNDAHARCQKVLDQYDLGGILCLVSRDHHAIRFVPPHTWGIFSQAPGGLFVDMGRLRDHTTLHESLLLLGAWQHSVDIAHDILQTIQHDVSNATHLAIVLETDGEVH